jgi:quercetin dioxygenase-like cupin family protein
VKRHPALVPLSHDHHHTLARARELRRAAAGDDAARAQASARFALGFALEIARHFREEEELVFPLLAGQEAAQDVLARAALQHARIRQLVGAGGEELEELADLLEAHVRLEERALFELLQELVPEERLVALGDELARPEDPDVVDLLAGSGRGPLWGTATEDLNATLLAWPEGGGTPEHVNDERDVVVVAVAGSGRAWVDGAEHRLAPGTALVIEKGRRRRIAAGRGGLRYVSVHRRRGGLSIGRSA